VAGLAHREERIVRAPPRASVRCLGTTTGWRTNLTDEGYTHFDRVFDRLLRSRGHNQSTFAAECRRRGFRLKGSSAERDVGQRSISDWLRGKTSCSREVPAIAVAVLDLSEEERVELGLAFAYGQTTRGPEENLDRRAEDGDRPTQG